jgi:hypothetical protein
LQGWYAAAFEREMGCTEGEWLMWLPGAVGGRPLQLGAGMAQVAIGAGTLRLSWQLLAERRIALMRLPRLAVQFAFDGVDEAERQDFMRYFDLYTRRGGG